MWINNEIFSRNYKLILIQSFSIYSFRFLIKFDFVTQKEKLNIMLPLFSNKLVHSLSITYTISRDNSYFHLILGHVLSFILRPTANRFILNWRLWRSTDGRSNFNTFPNFVEREKRGRRRHEKSSNDGKTKDGWKKKKLEDP